MASIALLPTRDISSALHRLRSFSSLLVGLLATTIYFMVPQSIADPDIWWHLRNAEYQVSTHSFIHRDMYSFTAQGAVWMNHEWLSELPFYLGWKLMGLRGLFVVTLCCIEVVLLGVFYLAYMKSKSPKAAFLVSVVAAILSTVSFGPRTLLFGWICLIVELCLLERFRENENCIWAMPVLFLFWINLHGSWLIGLVILVMFALCGAIRGRWGVIEEIGWTVTQQRKLVAACCATLPPLLINPYGWRLVLYPFDLAFRQRLNVATIEEWKTLDFHSPRGEIMLVVIAGMFLFQLIRARRWMPYEVGLVFLGTYASFRYSRFLFLAAILIMPILARDLSCFFTERGRQNRPLLNLTILFVLLMFCVGRFPKEVHTQTQQQPGRQFPEHAVSYLKTFHPEGNVFNDFLWGGYLIWHAPNIPVFIDSRVDIFEYNGAFKDYLDAVGLKGSRAVLDKYNIRYVLFQKDAPLVYLLEHTGSWKVNFEDETTVLLERSARVAK